MFIKKQSRSINIYQNINIIHLHDVTNYCYYVKPSNDIPIEELLEKYNIETEPVIFRRNSSYNKCDVAMMFIKDIVKVIWKIEKLLQINVPGR